MSVRRANPSGYSVLAIATNTRIPSTESGKLLHLGDPCCLPVGCSFMRPRASAFSRLFEGDPELESVAFCPVRADEIEMVKLDSIQDSLRKYFLGGNIPRRSSSFPQRFRTSSVQFTQLRSLRPRKCRAFSYGASPR